MDKIGKEDNLLKYAFLHLIAPLVKVHGVDNMKFVMDIRFLLMFPLIRDQV